MKILCTICARAGSKGVKSKNLKMLLGRPLISYTIEQALNSKLFELVVVSTDSKRIAKLAKKQGVECWFLRPKYLAKDSSPKLPVIKHALEKAEKRYSTRFETIIDLDPTSPLRSNKDIKKSLKIFRNKGFKNLITGSPSRRNPYFNMVEIVNGSAKLSKKSKITPTRRQRAPKVYDMNASIYIWNRKTLVDYDTIFTGNTGFYEMPEERSYDIDSKLDWKIVEMLMEVKLKKNE